MKKEDFKFNENISVMELKDKAVDAISVYAPNKNVYRHIPFMSDGLLPSERRVLYAMFKDVKAYPWQNYKKLGLTIGSNELPMGFKPIIPENTRLLGYSLDDELLKVDFSKEFLDISLDDEDKLIQSIVYSLTTLDEVSKIMIFIEGERLDSLPVSHKKLDLYLDRNYGINRVVDISKLSGSKMVTVYYLGKYNDYYYIPISYITDDRSESIEIIINNLRSNRLNSSYLSSHLDYQVELMNYEKNDDEFFLNFNESLLKNMFDGKLKEEVKYALSYSILDTYNIENVVFQVNSNKIDELRLAK